MPSFHGSCHCGRIGVEFSTEKAPASFSPRACQCSFCRRHGAVMISDPVGSLSLVIADEAGDPYRFGLGITDFHVCARCGVFVAATWQDTEGEARGVVNIHALAEERLFSAAPADADFDGEDAVARIERRRKNWTPVRVRQAVSG